ncbi:MAG: hypothetical protein U1F54_13400 [Burkholderiales bacterium]
MAATRLSSTVVARLAGGDVPGALERAWRLARHGSPDVLAAFDSAWCAATAREDHPAAAEAAAAAICIIDAEYRDFRSFDAWASRLDPASAHRWPRELPSASLLLLGARALCALHAAVDFDSDIDVASVATMLRDAREADQALLGATALIAYLDSARRERDAARIVVEAEPLAAKAGPWIAGQWLSIRGQHALFCHRLDEAYMHLSAALESARRHSLPSLATMTTLMLARLALARGNDAVVATRLAEAEPIDEARDPMWRAVSHQIRSLEQLHAGGYTAALHTARQALAWAGKAAAPDAEALQMHCLEGYCLAGISDARGAAAAFQNASSRGTRIQSRQAAILAHMATAIALAGDGLPEAARPHLAAAFAEVRALDYTGFLWPVPAVASRVCALALAAGIDVDYVRSVVRARCLVPPPDAPASWPFACRIEVLGRFRVVLDGRSLPADRVGASSKPLELLRAIAALGGRQVDADRVIGLLWPGKGRVGARSAFNVTLLRLRRLLGAEDLISFVGNEVSLNDLLVGVDLWSLEASLQAWEVAPRHRAGEVLASIVDRYGGSLLCDENAPWIAAERQRLRYAVDAALAGGVSHLRPMEAAALLSRALAADADLPLAASALRAATAAFLRDPRGST